MDFEAIDETEVSIMNDWKQISLNGRWQITYVSADDLEDDAFPRTMAALENYGESTIEGDVPGNFELSLEQAGILKDIYKDQNVLKLQKYEGYHVFYSRTFTYKKEDNYETELLFEGLDTICEIWINGEFAGRTENMAIPHCISPSNLSDGSNEIVVHFFPVNMEARKYEGKAGYFCQQYNYASLHIRKAPHMYGWDIAPRILSCGIYRPVTLLYRPKEYIRQAYVTTRAIDFDKQVAKMFFFFDAHITGADLSRYMITLEGTCEESRFYEEIRLWSTNGGRDFRVMSPKLWWPKGKGMPQMYDVTVTLKKDDRVLDTCRFRSGIRTAELVRTSKSDEELSGKFYFKINGEKVFILGTNFVPIDAFHSKDRERLPKVCELLEEVGCNAIRLWGGNIYEDEYLYDYCDEHGILIWQDFMMGCGIYPQDEEMCQMLEEEVKVTVRRLRNHASIMLWAGDNENDEFAASRKRNPDRNKLTRTVIPDVLSEEDPFRIYLPSSPYMDQPDREKSHPFEYCYPKVTSYTEQHLWGPRDYYKGPYYRDNRANFASEMGYHGCPSPQSVRTFLSEDNVWPWENNINWMVHAASMDNTGEGPYVYRIRLMAEQIRVLFGEIPDNLEDFSIASQISQAEAMKYFIEMFRLDKERRGGIIWWNLIDCWPQFSDAVVDYYYDKKLAYDYIKNCQKPILLSFSEPEQGEVMLKAVNDTGKELLIQYQVTDFETGEMLAEGTTKVGERVEPLTTLPYREKEKHFYVINWKTEDESGINHYLCGEPNYDLEVYRRFLAEVYGR